MGLFKRRFTIILLCTLFLILTHCRQNALTEKVGKKVEIAAAALNDAAITASIKTEIFNDQSLKVSMIDVTTTAGVVTLSGTVPSQLSVDRTVAIARGIKGVKEVESGEIIKGY
jgi:hyperosmotically inducible periplasmic protein